MPKAKPNAAPNSRSQSRSDPGNGYKRVELAYRQTVPVDQVASAFVLPLKPEANRPLNVENFSLTLELDSPQAISGFQVLSKSFVLKFGKQDGHTVKATFEANNFAVHEDFTVRYKLDPQSKPRVEAYRDPQSGDPGFFDVSTVLEASDQAAAKAPRTLLVLFDTSLSMQWDKLERSFQALEATLRALTLADHFNVLVFNSDVKTTTPDPVAATPAAVANALGVVRASTLRGGTNLEKALKLALDQSRTPNTDVVLLSDGEMTEGTVVPNKLANWFDTAWSAKPVEIRPHVYTLAIGDDANVRLIDQGWPLTPELRSRSGRRNSLEFKLAALIGKIGLKPFDSVTLNATPAANFDLVYRLEKSNYPASRASWVGEYKQPGAATFAVNATYGGRALPVESAPVNLPANETDHTYLPATWARARVDALLEKIDRDGEDAATIAEIIRLSRKYKFVTPYTSFLAAPRSLLRPRLIRPGDPVLRVRTDPSVVSVIALFPFGLTKPLRYLKEEDIWQTRFLAPPDMHDGIHTSPPDSARSRWPCGPRTKDVRHFQPATHRSYHAEQEPGACRRDHYSERSRVANNAAHHGPALWRRTCDHPLDRGCQSEHRNPGDSCITTGGPLLHSCDGRGYCAQRKPSGGAA